MSKENYLEEFQNLMKKKEYESALVLAEHSFPDQAHGIAETAYDYYMENKSCEVSLRIAENYFECKVPQAANATYNQWIKMEMYSLALNIAEEYIPEKTDYAAFLGIEDGINQYRSIIMGTNPDTSDELDKLMLDSLPEVEGVITEVADKYLDCNNMLHYFSHEKYHTYQMDVRSEFRSLEKLAEKKWKNSKKFNLEEKLKDAISTEDYLLAAKVQDKLKKL